MANKTHIVFKTTVLYTWNTQREKQHCADTNSLLTAEDSRKQFPKSKKNPDRKKSEHEQKTI